MLDMQYLSSLALLNRVTAGHTGDVGWETFADHRIIAVRFADAEWRWSSRSLHTASSFLDTDASLGVEHLIVGTSQSDVVPSETSIVALDAGGIREQTVRLAHALRTHCKYSTEYSTISNE